MPSQPQKLGDVLKALIDRLGIREELDDAAIVEAWAAVAGPEVNAYTETAWMRGRKLFVKITSAARRNQLHMRRSALKRQLNLELGSDVIDEIVFR